MLLPHSLLLLLHVSLTYAQATQQLSIGSLNTYTSANFSGSTSPALRLPPSTNLSVSVAICLSSQSLPRFFVTNNTEISLPGPSGGSNVFEIQLNDGYGNWTGSTPEGGVLAVTNVGGTPFEVGVTEGDSGPMHEVLTTIPLLGDTTSNQALIFSSPFSLPNVVLPTYPNYTLPPANLSYATQPSSGGSPDFTLVLAPTSSSSLISEPQTGCALRSATSVGSQIFQSLWLRDASGWRSEWLMGGLTPLTNYTAYVIENRTKVSGPIYFVTKSALFSCPLVHSVPYCPAVSYAVPLPHPPVNFAAHDARTLPESLTDPLLSGLTNFTTMLTTFACGRDIYSPLQTCADCQREYRNWLCAISFPRCSEEGLPSTTTSSIAAQQTGAQVPVSALVPVTPTNVPRNLNLPNITSNYSMLLPCLETCTAVDRACPYFLGFKCPLPQFNANVSYGVGFIDKGESGVQGHGLAGYSQDRYGNIWCQGPGLEEGVA
ncbi:hypothetical protein NEOLEDRAFT_1054732 [Neolentinus lepideus HHB14362 ss-1]|uniref:FZ domain-containing protein n=1 Tax=Neolentinus lepideus HHB14362 ss-1 TaxID=1314782 RepID=A0A165VVQ2_9AGAM|nr:hypothetical protein NEOLEDRAFT_1054732 [Neolentinus lepideus HHB14362 ss-1]